jgi:hypothetical protein
MDQTHTLTSGFRYRHGRTGLWTSMAFEYGSGTPAGHGGAEHEHEPAEGEHEHGAAGAESLRVPHHLTQNVSFGWDALIAPEQTGVSFQFNIENLSNNVYVVAKESVFTPGQYSIPRLYSASMKIQF